MPMTLCGGARMIKRTLGCTALWGWLMASGSLQAHHSLAGVYDMKAEKELAGTVEKVQFVNPHRSLTISVKNPDGSATEWGFTLRSAPALAQRGVGKTGPKGLPHRDTNTMKMPPATDGPPLRVL